MLDSGPFHPPRDGLNYLAEGGTETEIMFRHGHELRDFAMFELMDKVALCKLGHIEEGDPQELGRMMGDLARRYPHIDIWGGCCGTWDNHFHEIARHVKAART